MPLPETFYFKRRLAELKQRLLVEWRTLNHSIVVAAVSQWRRRFLSTFYGVFTVLCVKLMLIVFEFGVLLFDCFVYRQNVTCLKRFTRYGHYAGEVEDVIIDSRLSLKSVC